jgi:hypothetical protein
MFPRSFEDYRGCYGCGEDRFAYLEVRKLPRVRLIPIGLTQHWIVSDPRFHRYVRPVHNTINQRFVNRGFRFEIRSFGPEHEHLAAEELTARAIFTLAESGQMSDVLGEIDYDKLISHGMASVEPRFIQDALIFGITGGAYAPKVEDQSACEGKVEQYRRIIPGGDDYEVIAINPNVSPWFWAEWIDFFCAIIRRDQAWIAIYAASDTD